MAVRVRLARGRPPTDVGDVERQPVEERVADQLGEEQTQRELDHALWDAGINGISQWGEKKKKVFHDLNQQLFPFTFPVASSALKKKKIQLEVQLHLFPSNLKNTAQRASRVC